MGFSGRNYGHTPIKLGYKPYISGHLTNWVELQPQGGHLTTPPHPFQVKPWFTA